MSHEIFIHQDVLNMLKISAMVQHLKRYMIALLFLLLVTFLMLIGTYGVKKFGDTMLENTDEKIQPVGTRIVL